MKPEAIIICRPDVDMSTFLGVALKTLGHSLAATADASGLQLSDAGRFLSCLASLRSPKAGVELNLKLLPHVSFSVLIVADELDMMDILECAAGMPFVTAETIIRGVLLVIVTGTLIQWRAAVIAGSSCDVEPTVRFVFNRLHGLFKDERLDVWGDFRQRPAHDQVTYLLEDKRGR
jgi:hypothetical protein